MKATAEHRKDERAEGVSASAPHVGFRSRAEHLAAGKSLRETLPRDRHAVWKRPAKGRDPIAILEASNRDRLPDGTKAEAVRVLAAGRPARVERVTTSLTVTVPSVLDHEVVAIDLAST